MKKILVIAIAVQLFFSGCIKQVDVKTRNEKPILVVEGGVTTDSVPYTVKLSYSGPFTITSIPDEYIEKNASVTITDDLGNTTKLVHSDQGIYQTTDSDYIGKVGRSYSVIIELENGKKYVSIPEKISPPVPISNINVQYNFGFPSYFAVYIDANDPAGEENYYKWSFYSWDPRKTHGLPCAWNPTCRVFDRCLQKFTNPDLNILSDAAINGNTIKEQLMGYSYIYDYGKHYIDISQSSVTCEAYQFFERLKDQQTRTGHILDPLPASVKGNIYNAADSNDFALGYFSASSDTHERKVLVPYSITRYLLDATAVEFIPEGDKICFKAFPNTIPYGLYPDLQNPPPPGWENAEIIKMYW